MHTVIRSGMIISFIYVNQLHKLNISINLNELNHAIH